MIQNYLFAWHQKGKNLAVYRNKYSWKIKKILPLISKWMKGKHSWIMSLKKEKERKIWLIVCIIHFLLHGYYSCIFFPLVVIIMHILSLVLVRTCLNDTINSELCKQWVIFFVLLLFFRFRTRWYLSLIYLLVNDNVFFISQLHLFP